MTDVAFHFGAPDKVAYTCRLLRKAVGAGARVVVTADQPQLDSLSQSLWGVSATDFVAHCFDSAPATLVERSPVLLAGETKPWSRHRPVLVNLGLEVPEEYQAYQRVIEVVSLDEQDRLHARRRWKLYTEAGYQITRHDLKLAGSNG